MSELALRGEPSDEIARLEAEIASRQKRVAVSLGNLQRRVNDALSWRHWAGAHPIAWICAGVCLGLVIGRGARRAREAE
jgi:hypothetical protein